MPTPADADCGELSCSAFDYYRSSVGHFRGDVYIVTADELIVREMIRREMGFLQRTKYASQYRMLELDRIRYGVEGPMHYLEEKAALDATVEREARLRVFRFLYAHDPTFRIVGTPEQAAGSNYAR